MAAKIKRDDTVQVMTGRDRGRRGEVRQVLRKQERAIVTGVNMMRKHRRSTDPTQPSQILDIEGPIHLSNLRVVCSACNNAVRVGFRIVEGGRKVRVCKQCDEAID
jgi:large subunit ribosomal protein L24